MPGQALEQARGSSRQVISRYPPGSSFRRRVRIPVPGQAREQAPGSSRRVTSQYHPGSSFRRSSRIPALRQAREQARGIPPPGRSSRRVISRCPPGTLCRRKAPSENGWTGQRPGAFRNCSPVPAPRPCPARRSAAALLSRRRTSCCSQSRAEVRRMCPGRWKQASRIPPRCLRP